MNSTAYIDLGLSTAVTSQNNGPDMLTGQSNLGNPTIEAAPQMILGCVKSRQH